MPQALIDGLEVGVNRLIARTLPGERAAAGLGPGIELAQLRPYKIGDDVRHIDPAATARSGGQPHIRLHVPERALTTWIVLDVSASMAFGTVERLKADVAEGVALTFGTLGVRQAGSIGVMTFGAGEDRVLPPRGAKPGIVALRRLLAEGVAPDGAHDPDGLSRALQRLGRVARLPGLVVVISDFRDHRDWERPLGSLRLRHTILAIEVGDPKEAAVPNVGRLALIDPETGARIEVDTSRRRVRERFAELERRRREEIAQELRRLQITHLSLSSDERWLAALGRHLR